MSVEDDFRRAWKELDDAPLLQPRSPMFLPQWAFLAAAEMGILGQLGPVIVHPDAIRRARERGLL